MAGQSFAISPCEPVRLNYYVYVYFLNTASSSRCLDGQKRKISCLHLWYTDVFLFFLPPPRHELLRSVSPCEPLGLDYVVHFTNTASSSRFTGGGKKQYSTYGGSCFCCLFPSAPRMRLHIAYSSNIAFSLNLPLPL